MKHSFLCAKIYCKGGGVIKDIKIKVQELIDKYEENFSQYGIKLDVSKKYFEEAVAEDTHFNHGLASLIVDRVENIFYRKKEKNKGYNRVRNRYHCLVISVLPIDKTKVPRDICKEYAFFLKKIARAHIGLAPKKYTLKENKLLEKIEKRILKILKSAKRKTLQKVCRDTLLDALRYSMSIKYKYKKRILGRDIYFWHIIEIVAVVSLVLCFSVFFVIINS